MTYILRIEFKSHPTPAVLAAILANAVSDPNYRDHDALEDQD